MSTASAHCLSTPGLIRKFAVAERTGRRSLAFYLWNSKEGGRCIQLASDRSVHRSWAKSLTTRCSRRCPCKA